MDLREYVAPEGRLAYERIRTYDAESPITITRAYRAVDPWGEWECAAYYTSNGKSGLRPLVVTKPARSLRIFGVVTAFSMTKSVGISQTTGQSALEATAN